MTMWGWVFLLTNLTFGLILYSWKKTATIVTPLPAHCWDVSHLIMMDNVSVISISQDIPPAAAAPAPASDLMSTYQIIVKCFMLTGAVTLTAHHYNTYLHTTGYTMFILFIFFYRSYIKMLNNKYMFFMYMYRVDQKKVCSQKTKIGHGGGFLKKTMTIKIKKFLYTL